jgi:probable phosphomutase (TIGR03848 family)
MALVLLIRHAVTEVTGKRLSGQTPGIHLSDEGRQQAMALVERLAPVPLAAIYSSPLERCMETAQAVAAQRGLAVEPVPELTEVGYGRWTGRPLAVLARTSLWKQIQQAPSTVRFPEGETLTEVQRRSAAAIDSIAARHARTVIGVCSHADVIRLLLAHYAGVHIDLFQRLIVSPVSVSAVLLDDRIPRIIRMNDTGTLSDLSGSRRPAARKRSSRQPGARGSQRTGGGGGS